MWERWKTFGPPKSGPRHVHQLMVCHDCDGDGCSYCDFRGYLEICEVCREPMGNARRKWKRFWRDQT